MNPTRPRTRRRALILALGAAALTTPFAAAAQSFPSRPITIIAPFAPGGTTDLLARIIGQYMSSDLGQPVVVENRVGAGGNIGAQMAAKAAPDGHTLFMGSLGTNAINPSLYKKLPFDAAKDFTAVSRVAMVPNLLVAHPSQPYRSVVEMIAYGKENPGKINFGSSGAGGSPHLSGELFKSMTSTEMVHVPYKGSAPAMADLLGGQISIMFDNMPSALPNVKAGKLRALGITSAKRSPQLPDVPTIAEAGVPGYDVTSWFGIFVPSGTPSAIVDRLNSSFVKAINDPSVRAKISEQGAEPFSEKPEAFAGFVQAEAQKWARIVKVSGATAE